MIQYKPIQLNMGQPPLTISTVFEEKLLSAYELMPAQITPKELLLLTTSPPELPEDLGGMTTVAVSTNQANYHELSLHIVNNVVNRLLLSQENGFTYQDSVYLTMALHKLGVTDVNQFMRQVRALYDESVSIGRLNTVYRDNVSRLQTLLERTRESQKSSASSETGEQAVLPAPRYYLHSEIYERLQTAEVYETFCSLLQNRQLYTNSLFHNELKVSEQSRVSQELNLWNTKQTLLANQHLELVYASSPQPENAEEQEPSAAGGPAAAVPQESGKQGRPSVPARQEGKKTGTPAGASVSAAAPRTYVALHHHVNRYETGELLPPPQTEEQVIEQGAQAVLLSLTDQVLSTQINRLSAEHHRQQWIDIRQAISQSVQNTLERYREYHTVNVLNNRTEQVENRSLTALYRQEANTFSSLLEQYGDLTVELTRLEKGQETAGPLLVHREEAQPEAEEAVSPASPGQENAEQAHVIEEHRKLTELTQRILRTDRKAEAAQKAVAARRMPPPELRRELLRERETQLRERCLETVRELSGAETRMILAGQSPESAPALTQQTIESLQQFFRHTESFTREGDRLLHSTHTIQTGPSRTENRFEQVQLLPPQESAPVPKETSRVSMPQQAEAVSQQELVRELDRINERNREILRTLREETQRKESEQSKTAPPDPGRMFRDSLQAMQNPEQFLRELAERPPELTHQRPQETLVETILEHTDERTRELYRVLLEYQNNPAEAVAKGLVRQAGAAEINAPMRAVQERRLEELTHLQREQLEQQETIREHVDSVVERYLEPQSAQEPQMPQEAGRTASARIVHRTPEQPFSEELLELLEQRRTTEVKQEEVTNTVTQEKVSQTELNTIRQQVVERTAEDIGEIVNRTLARQIGTISEKVYGQMERRLQSERARRGWK